MKTEDTIEVEQTEGSSAGYRVFRVANHPGAETSDPTGTNDNQSAGFSEVQSMQAAGVLVYAPAGAEYSWNLEQAADMKVEISGSNPTTTEMNLPTSTSA